MSLTILDRWEKYLRYATLDVEGKGKGHPRTGHEGPEGK